MNNLYNIRYKEQNGYFYLYLEDYSNDCYCMWKKNHEQEMVYSIERLDILHELRRKGLARKLLNDAIKRISVECPKACIEIIAKADKDSDITTDNLVTFYKSLDFEEYQRFESKVILRLYIDESIKPQPVFDSPCYFRVII